MTLFCTAALQKKMGWNCPKAPTPTDPLDGWYATLVSLHGADTVVAILPAFRFCVILWDPPENAWANLNQVLVHEIRQSLDSCFYEISRTLIDKYLPAGTVFELCTTADRNVISNANPVTAKIISADFPSLWDVVQRTSEPFNPYTIQGRVNRAAFPAKDGSGKIQPWRALKTQLQQKYGLETAAYELEVSLDLEQHVARRTLRVAADNPFGFLGAYVHTAFYWSYTGNHQFILPPKWDFDGPLHFLGRGASTDVVSPNGFWFDDEVARLSEYLSEGDHLQYLYYRDDIQNPWKIDIQVSQYIPSTEELLPVCTLCEGLAPPEWVDGPAGYREFCEIVSNPKDPRCEQMRKAGKNWLQEDTAQAITAYLPMED